MHFYSQRLSDLISIEPINIETEILNMQILKMSPSYETN